MKKKGKEKLLRIWEEVRGKCADRRGGVGQGHEEKVTYASKGCHQPGQDSSVGKQPLLSESGGPFL